LGLASPFPANLPNIGESLIGRTQSSMKPNPYIRLHSFVSADSLLLAFAAAASVAIGAMVTKSPVAAIGLLVVCSGIFMAFSRPVLLFAIGIASLAVEPAKIFGAGSVFASNPEAYKLILYACFIPLLFKRGLVPRKCAPLVAYAVVTVFSEAFGTRLPGLTTSQTASSVASLSLAWLVFAINWDWRRDHPLLKTLACVPIISVLVGLALQAAGVWALFSHASPPRLGGATTTAWLGTFGVCAVVACIVLSRREQWRWAQWIGLIDAAILGATLTRGAVIALGIVALPPLVRFSRRQLSAKGINGMAKLGMAVAIAIVGAATVIPGLEARNENAVAYNAARGVVTHEIASGRFQSWAFTYEQAKVNLAFGRGVGAGPIVGDIPGSPPGFTAQHNEYLRMLLETGIIGGVILLMTMITTIVSQIRRSPPQIRADLAAAGVAFALYSITENTLSAPPLAVAFLLVFGIAGSRASLSPRNAQISRPTIAPGQPSAL
jgi:O-antigen ligase